MDAFDVCVRCSRHIRRTESLCPFCHAPFTPAPSRPRPTSRASRAAWLATTFASGLVVAACSAAVEPTSSETDAGKHDAGSGQATADSGKGSDRDGSEDASAVVPGLDAADEPEVDAGWHTCYGAPPARLERA